MYLLLMLLAILLNTLFRYEQFNVEFAPGKSSYYIGQALSFVLILFASKYRESGNKINDAVYRITIWIAISNLFDELFFDPLHLGLNEILFAGAIILYEIVTIVKNGPSTTSV